MSIELIVGPMFSGKTTELQRRVRIARLSNKQIALFKWKADTRYRSELVVSHDKISTKAFAVHTLEKARSVIRNVKPDVVAVDEGQFFGEELIQFCIDQREEGRRVIVSALPTKADFTAFQSICLMLAHADQVDKFSSICVGCNQNASYTKKIGGHSGQDIEVGGAALYMPVCHECWKLDNIDANKWKENFNNE